MWRRPASCGGGGGHLLAGRLPIGRPPVAPCITCALARKRRAPATWRRWMLLFLRFRQLVECLQQLRLHLVELITHSGELVCMRLAIDVSRRAPKRGLSGAERPTNATRQGNQFPRRDFDCLGGRRHISSKRCTSLTLVAPPVRPSTCCCGAQSVCGQQTIQFASSLGASATCTC